MLFPSRLKKISINFVVKYLKAKFKAVQYDLKRDHFDSCIGKN